MNLTAVMMVKNEIDVIQESCSHLAALFDHLVIIDHRSTDGTKEYIDKASRFDSGVHVYSLEEPGYYQSQLMTWAVREIDICRNSDWLFFLDADEILPFLSRDEFVAKMRGYEEYDVIKMPWNNLVPLEYEDGFMQGREYYETGSSSVFHKVAFQPRKVAVDNCTVAQGNHAVFVDGREIPGSLAFDILHIPVRSREQLYFKVLQGTATYSLMHREKNSSLGSHWFEILEYIEANGVSKEMLNGLAFQYGHRIDIKNIAMDKDQLIKSGCKVLTLNYAKADMPPVGDYIKDGNRIDKMLSDIKSCAVADIDNKLVSFKLSGNNEIICMGDKNMYFKTLEDRGVEKQSESDLSFLVDFLSPSTMKIESITSTAWGGHIPFLFCLFSLMRPRVYVELGSHFGASFFAACQAAQVGNLDAKVIAIDLWEGDDHAGYYGESVFESFHETLTRKYADVGDYLRMHFDAAADHFDDKSIDLLHIDGLHTYEAVKHDYETWKSKVSGNGVILFHDTNVHERGFGVWQLWEEISKEHLSFEFKHTHGLGVVALGSPENNPVSKLLEMVNKDNDLAEFMENYFSRIGALAFDEAVREKESSLNMRSRSSSQRFLYVMLRRLKGALIRFVKSVPILRRIAYSVLRFVRG